MVGFEKKRKEEKKIDLHKEDKDLCILLSSLYKRIKETNDPSSLTHKNETERTRSLRTR